MCQEEAMPSSTAPRLSRLCGWPQRCPGLDDRGYLTESLQLEGALLVVELPQGCVPQR